MLEDQIEMTAEEQYQTYTPQEINKWMIRLSHNSDIGNQYICYGRLGLIGTPKDPSNAYVVANPMRRKPQEECLWDEEWDPDE